MHRHGYKGRKFHRETDQRSALLKGLTVSLIKYGQIETTLIKAKEIRPFAEKLVTKAKQNDLHSRRQIMASLSNKSESNRLVDEIAPLISRSSGYLRIRKTKTRRGDNTQLAIIEFVDLYPNTEIKASKAKLETVKETSPKLESVEELDKKESVQKAKETTTKEKVTTKK